MKSPVKTKTIARRLYGMLALLLFMFIGCLALILWTEGRNSRQMVSLLGQREQLEKQSARVRFNMMQMSDAMRGALLDSTNQEEFKRKVAADKDLEAAVAAMQPLVADRPDLLSALNAIGEFDAKKLNKFEDELMGMVASDPKAAAKYYVTTYLPVRHEEDALVDTFLAKVHDATHAGIAKSESAKTMGLAAAAGMILLCLLLGRLQVVAVNHSLAGLADSLADSSAHVSGAATEVATASQSVAEGASQQAASLEETSASLEEMSSMTRRTAASAEDAKQLAAQTRAAADAGAGEMRQMSRAMAEIKTASDNIAKIIKTIDEIAFQTNILALNAAVEAARAGEAGMGFAVVADEVRNLAQRSAQAARETAASIEDSIRKSEAGVQYSGKVAGNLEEIVIKARKVDELIAEIASACHEQNQGITQVNTATMQMDKVTQSNAASAEESASAAGELNTQADTLKNAVEELLGLVGGQNATLAKPALTSARMVPAPASSGHARGSNGHARTHGNGRAPVLERAAHASFPMPELQRSSRPPLNGTDF